MAFMNRDSSHTPSVGAITVLMLVIVGVTSLIIAEQVLTGWLALGERANISRRDMNPIEVGVIATTTIWGLAALRGAWGFLRRENAPTIREYFASRLPMPPGVLLTTVLLVVVGAIALVIAEQVLTGWLALGERVNISRRDLNYIEWMVIFVSALWGLVTLRTAWGFLQRDRAAWTWSQWVILATSLIGLGLLIEGVFHISRIVPPRGTLFDNLAGVQELVAPGLIMFLSCLAAYRYVTVEVDTSAAQSIRNTLAKSAGAGAIVGFVAIFAFFSLATDLFLEPRALAGALSTNITNGIVAIGITMLMISGEFDLSVGSIHGASALVFLLTMTEQRPLLVSIAESLGMQPAMYEPLIPIVAAVAGLLFAALLGLINGIILIRTGIPSFIVTLGTLLAYRAIPLVVVAEGRILRYADFRLPPPNIYFSPWILIVGALLSAIAIALMGRSLLPSLWRRFQERWARPKLDRHDMTASTEDDLRDFFIITSLLRFILTLLLMVGVIAGLLLIVVSLFGRTGAFLEVSFFDLVNGRIGSLPLIGTIPPEVNLRIGILWWAVLVIIFQFILNQTPYGNYTFAVGGNPGAALAQGINVTRVKLTNFVLSGLMAGIAGLTYVSRVTSVNANLGEGLELEVIAASVIGGTLLSGGYGSIFGALLGVLIFGMLRTGLVLIGMDPRVFFGVIGVIIIVAVIINTAVRRIRT